MQIGTVGFYILNRNRGQTGDKSQALTNRFNKNVSFQKFDPNVIKNMRDMPCLCCGVKMIPYRDYAAKFSLEALSGSCKNAIKLLMQYKQNMHRVERVCLKKIRDAALRTPSKTLQEIVTDLRPEALKKLQTDQLAVMDKIDAVGKKKLPDTLSEKLTEFLSGQRASIIDESGRERFKRKNFLTKLTAFTEQIPQKKVREQIINIAQRLNTSQNDFNAFIVKYSGRSSAEIEQRLVYPSVKTREHLVARNSIDGNRGTNDSSNVSYTCQRCNGENKGNITLSDWAAAEPRMSRHKAQAYFDFFMEKISQGKIPPEYVATLYRQAQTLINGSGGRIKIDTSFSRLADKAA